jgi:hypothetical protein
MNKVLGIGLVALALAIAIVPHFTSCHSTSTELSAKMPCQQTASAEIVVGAPLAVVGASAFLSKKKGALIPLSLIGVALGVSAILLPTVLVGVCPGGLMHCNVYMKPLLIVFGMGTVMLSAGLAASSRKYKE